MSGLTSKFPKCPPKLSPNRTHYTPNSRANPNIAEDPSTGLLQSMESSSSDDEHVTLVCKNPHSIETETENKEIHLSTDHILHWDLHAILPSPTIKIRALRSTLIHQSSYFRGLFRGSFRYN